MFRGIYSEDITMNCKILKDNLLAYVDSETSDVLPEALIKDLDLHVSQCEKCEARVREEINIRSVLSALPVKPMNANFRNRVMDSIKEKQTQKKQYGYFAGFSAAVAASVLIWVTAVYISSPGNNATAIQSVVLVLNEVKHVKLAFNAPVDFDEVTLTIDLPKHVELEGFVGESQISWQTSLNSGKNILELPLIVKDIIQGEIVATIRHSEKSKVFKIPLSTLVQGVGVLETKDSKDIKMTRS